MKIPFFDRTRADAAIEPELVAAFREVVRSGQYILGPEVLALEAACAPIVGAEHAVAVSSGTDALMVALMALGVRPGDEVICPAYTFFATAGAVFRLGARPVFADVLPGCLTLDPDDAARRITPKTRGIIAVHLFGQCADLARLTELARASGVWLIEDCAQAMGAERDGQRAGGAGVLGCFSFFPTKNLGGFGDGGLVATSDAEIADRARVLRVHGGRPKNHHAVVGGNFRIDALQAALLRVKLGRLDDAIARRRENAALYDRLFLQSGVATPAGDGPIALGARQAGHTFNQYVIRVRGGGGTRDGLRSFLEERGIGSEIYYPVPLHMQPCFASPGQGQGELPVSEVAARETLALPIFPELLASEIEHVADQVEAYVRRESA